jgi:3-phenylpropionate/cinnamic acid dioxygenase small subunit
VAADSLAGVSSPPEEDIRRTLARYCMLCDDGRFHEWGELFTENARFHVMGSTHEGRADITAFIEKGMPPEQRGKHVIVNPLIELDSWNGTADVWSDFVFVDRSGAITQQGRYHDVMERGYDTAWRFTLREIVFPGDEPQLTKPPPSRSAD